jgi:hypothetical protein
MDDIRQKISSPLMKKISEELKRLRCESKKSLTTVARCMDTNEKQVWRIENPDLSSSTIMTIERYAHALGYQVEFSFIKNA